MKVFVSSGEMAKNNPRILAFYPDDSDVGNDAHGTGVQVFTVSPDSIGRDTSDPTMSVSILVGDWRQRTERAKMFSLRDRVNLTYELLRLIMKNGPDVTTWPSLDRDREIAIQRRWDLS